MPESYLEIQLDQQPIELCKLLKIADLVAGGGEAKVVISEGYVLLNGEVEYQKRKKVYHNDIVEFNGEIIQVVINENLIKDGFTHDEAHSSDFAPVSEHIDTQQKGNYIQKNAASKSSTQKNVPKTNKQKKAAPTNEGTANKNKRKPISF